MRWIASRTGGAAILVGAAIAVPGTAWFLSGSEQAAREAEGAVRQERERALAVATALAVRLARRLEDLRRLEARRPYYHYQNLFHDPEGASEGLSLVRSPLALGPADRLVRAHFQIDAGARVTLPTLNDEVPGPQARDLRAEHALRAELATVASELRPGSAARETGEAPQIQTLAPLAWLQNQNPNQIYQQLQNKVDPRPMLPAGGGGGRARIAVGPFRWRSVTLAGRPTLAALREVNTPAGPLRQGWVVSTAVVNESFQGAAVPAAFRPGPPPDGMGALVPIEGATWHVAALPVGIDAVAGRAGEIRARFFTAFVAGSAVALLAGVGVVLLVWQSERLARQRSRFAASAAHELRTPLAGMRMYGEMLAEGLGDLEKAREYARRIAMDAERLGRVVGNVLQFTGLERGIVAARTELGDLGPVVRECIARLCPVIEGAGATVDLEIHEPLPPVCFHRESVFQILQNLLDNAEKYTRGHPDRSIRVSLIPGPERSGVVLTVSDRGPGIPAAMRRRLFRAFARGGGPAAPAGLGLGLTLARALARAQGGDLGCADVPGRGATFAVTFRA